MFRQAQRSVKLPEAGFQVSAKLCLGSRSNEAIANFSYKMDKLVIVSCNLLPKQSFAENRKQASGNLPDLCVCLNTHIGMVSNTLSLGVKTGFRENGDVQV